MLLELPGWLNSGLYIEKVFCALTLSYGRQMLYKTDKEVPQLALFVNSHQTEASFCTELLV